MRQPIRRRRKSKDWMLTYGLTTLFVVGSLWYLDLLPLDEFLKSSSPDTEQAAKESNGSESSEMFGSQEEAEAAMAEIEQWEPEVTTAQQLDIDNQDTPFDAERPELTTGKLPATPASLASEKVGESPPASGTLPFPPPPETEPPGNRVASNFSPDHARSQSERERIARIFGTQVETFGQSTGSTGNTTTAPGGSGIIPTSAERPSPGVPLTDDSFAQVDQWIAEGQYLKAHRELSQRYWKEQEPLEPLLKRLNQTAGMIYFAPQPHFMPAYEVQPGDLLQSVAPQYKMSWEYLARLNRVRPERIRPGRKLKVIKGPFSAFIDLSEFSLTIHAHGYFVKRYPIGIGKDNSTPIGTFSVKDKLKNPKYYGTDAVIEADDPNNPLGERWIDIGDSYGIHGTIDPSSIGKAESRGCLRLTNEDVVEVYDFLIPGSEVVIRP